MLKRLFQKYIVQNKSILESYENDLLEIEALEAEFVDFSDDQLRAVVAQMKIDAAVGTRLEGAFRNKAFALVKVASQRVTGRRPHKVQVLAGLVLSSG